MAGKIFINYRREDSIGTAGRLHDRLAQAFGRKNLFMDVDHIPVGVDFVEYLNTQLAACDVFLAVIGPNWLDAKNDDGGRRLHDPGDFVAIEISAALARKIRVIPVLIDGARMPDSRELPEPLKPLVRRHAITLRHAHFGRDAEALIERVHDAEGAGTLRPGRRPALIATAAALFLAGVIVLIKLGIPVWMSWSPKPGPTGIATAKELNPAPTIVGSPCPDDYRAFDADSPPLACTCSAEATRGGSVYGMEVYPGLSTVCRAALHAGVIDKNGGRVTVISEPGRASYAGVTRNSVQSGNWREFKNSFRFATEAGAEAKGQDQ
jgi:LCCL domain/TIR domain